MDYRSEVQRLLEESGAVLLRSKKHQVWQLPNGKKFVRSQTPSDQHSDRNNFSDLRRVLGIVDETRGQEGERREKKLKTKKSDAVPQYKQNVNNGLANQLRLAGIIETAVRSELESEREQNKMLSDEIDSLQNEVKCLAKEIHYCSVCSFRIWLKSKYRKLVDTFGW